ncbi:CCAAT/enhancer-binding protein zeta [Polyodon spathula]|uniref:CCAAT/enhancer-binding protein zeta n=1 Tax=Polyodon spathula TaxID=7913 RepID=UPI001B7E3E6C|nr:CCAAT/enhancer-binding protein zeta [Polyodon spathula]
MAVNRHGELELSGDGLEEENEQGEDAEEGGEDEDRDKDFNLDDVLLLGGTRADFVMLDSLNENVELVDGGKKSAMDDLKEGELENFIEKIGIRSYSQRLQVLKEEPAVQETKAEGEKESRKAQPQTGKQAKAAKGEGSAGKQEGKKKPVQLDEVSSTTRTGKKHKQQNVFEFQKRTLLLIKPGGKWYNLEYTTEFTSQAQGDSEIGQYKALAQKLFEAETGLYKSKKNLLKGGNSAWMKTVVSTGTLVDRMAAMTLLIQDAPVHSLQFVEILVNLVKRKGSRGQNLMALDTLRELLISDLLPENRKLKTFAEHPFSDLEGRCSGNKDARDRRLILWYFEHQLKHQVAEFVMALETLAHDMVGAIKARALMTAHELLCSSPEQEKALLIQVVNKLGDPQYKTAAKASYLLETLLHKHPNMKTVVCYEVERLLYRPNVHFKAQYYAICFLNQLVLSHEERDLANKLITIYFSFFRGLVKRKDIESKMLSALLSGVNRAYPYANVRDEKIREQLDTLFKVVHVVNFNTALQALMLLFQVMDSQQAVSDRYYVALYKKLLDPGLAVCSKQSMFLNLLYKSLKADIVLRRVKAFVKRVLQVGCEQSPTFMCGALYLVSEVMKAKPGLQVLLQEHGETDEEEKFKDIDEDDEEEHFTDVDKENQEESETQADKSDSPKPAASWVHHKNQKSGKNAGGYDPMHRNPLYCGSDSTSLWELKKLSEHFHPSVALFARTILQGDFIQYTGDPLQDFTLMRFLDRFVYRNPKQNRGKENTDSVVMQPKQKLSMSNVCGLPVNSQQFLDRDESQIPVDEVFFHRYFKKRDTEKRQSRPHGGGDDESLEDVEDEEFEKILDSYEGDSYFTALEEGDILDFAGNVKSKSRKGKKSTEDSDSDLDEDDAEDLDDEEVSLGSMDEEDFGDELEDDGGAFMDLGDDEDEDSEIDETPQTSAKTTGKRKNSEELDFTGSAESKPGRKKKKGFKDKGSMFAAAEEFGYLLDENTGSKFDNIGINAVANRDKADIKQLKWETQRDDWLRGRDAKTLRKKKMMFKRKKPQGKLKGSNKKARK